MRILSFIAGVSRTIIWLVMTVALMLLGVGVLIYSPWSQEQIRQRLVAALNGKEGTTFRLDKLRLHFPLDLDLEGVTYAVDGDTMINAAALRADVALMPLLHSKVEVRKARLTDGFYHMGTPDSTMYLRIWAADMQLHPAKVDLSTMDIDLEYGYLKGGKLDMTIKQDTTPSDTASEPTKMKIRIAALDVDSLTYVMRMLPTIDSLGTTIGKGRLCEAVIDLGEQRVDIAKFGGERLNVAYIAPDAATIAANPVVETPPSDSPPWTISIDSICFTNSRALYTTRGVRPQPGLDFAYIEARDMDLTITDFYNRATELRLPLELHATERCGLRLAATGTFQLRDDMMYLRRFRIKTPQTSLFADASMGMGDMMSDPTLPLALEADGYLALADVRTMFPGYAPYLKIFPANAAANIGCEIRGTPSRLRINSLLLGINGIADITASGQIDNVLDPDRIAGNLALTGNIINVDNAVKEYTPSTMHLAVPPMHLEGNVAYAPGHTRGELTAKTRSGSVAMKGEYNSRSEGYAIDLDAREFPVNAFLPDMGIGRATLSLNAKGQGFDLFKTSTHIDAKARVDRLEYDQYDFRNIELSALIDDGHADVDGSVRMTDIEADFTGEGNLMGNSYCWKMNLDSEHIDLFALHLTEAPADAAINIDIDADFTSDMRDIRADVHLADLLYTDSVSSYNLSDIFANFITNDSLTSINLNNRDLTASAMTPYYVTDIAGNFMRAADLAMLQVKERRINVDTLQKVLPRFVVNVNGGSDNVLNEILAPSDMALKHIALTASNDSVLFLNSQLLGLRTGATLLDTINVDIVQQQEKMHFIAAVNNVPGNMDNWAHIKLDGTLNTDKVALRMTQQNNKMETGFDIGATAALADSTIKARFFPLNPIIGYKKWTVNLDNYAYYNFYTHRIDANIKMKGDNSAIQLFSQQSVDVMNKDVNDIVLRINDIHLQDWISFNPFAPPITGNLSADMKVRWDGASDINGDGNIELSDFFYDNRKVASMLMAFNVHTNLQGTIRAEADLRVDGKKTMTLAGNLNDSDSDSPFKLDFSMIQFPLSTVNPFLPADMIQLRGTLNGNMMISGDSDHPLFNGEIDFEDAAVNAAMTATSYGFSTVKIPVENNVVKFNNFSINAQNENPLYINGTVDVSSLTSPRVDLSMKARNMMLVNTQRASKGATVYGKGWIDLDADIKGDMRYMAVDADIKVKSGSNVTYIMTESTNAISSQATEGMVKFVNLNDTSAVAAADSLSQQQMLLNIDAMLTIEQGTTINVDLSTSNRDKVMVQPQGTITYTQMPMADGRLVGRINLDNGFARYTLPVINSEKNFNLEQGSYVAFNGDVLNPVLNIAAVSPMKVNVSHEGQNSRLVNFDVLLNVTGTLERMDVKFDLTTQDDLSVANELQTMSAEQRANQAMNMLLYNMYTGPGSSGAINLTANPLFSFLESQINNWAANNIKGVDLQFGIDQYNKTVNGSTSSAMSYSYQVSKTLFNDRFKIVVGGNYTTDENADENIAENLINDISFEYYLNKQQTMVLRLFRHIGYESILEGEVVQTGVGFVYKRKLDRLSNILPKFMRPKYKD